MADGQRPIKNSLLSAATGANFFEDAALFVPVVPLVEPEAQEPATAEIDLNSDDSPSNRASVERDFGELMLNEAVPMQASAPPPDVEEYAAPPISLFSRAATTGVDFFSGMLAGSSSSKIDNTAVINQNPVKVEPLVPTLNASTTVKREAEPQEEPSVVTLFSAPPTRLNALTPTTSHTDFLSNIGQPPTNITSDNGDVPSAAALFSSSSAFVPVNLAPRNSASFPLVPPVAPYTMTPSTSAVAAPSTSSFPGVPVFPVAATPASYAFQTVQPPLTSIPTSAISSPTVPFIPSSTQNVAGSLSSPYQATPPIPHSSGNSNSFRLGGQRMKYVACPEMKSAPVSTPNLPFNPMVVPSPPQQISSTFTPVPGPSAKLPLQMGALNSTPTEFPQQGIQGGVFSPSGAAQNNPQHVPNFRTSVNSNNFYGTQANPFQANVPQELPSLTYHWFFRKDVDGKTVWKPFSIIDSVALEDAYTNEPERLVPTDGGRYDVCVQKRFKMAVYWEETPIEVRRGSWFFKGPMDSRFIPYDEDFSGKLESEYADCMKSGIWQKRLEFPDGESVIMHNAAVVVHFCQAAAPDDWGNLPESQIRPRVVKRGVEEIEVEDGESSQVDHLVFVVHGIGPICDFKLRNIVEAVDDFRGLSLQLIHSHFRESIEKSLVGRVEFLPVSWHKSLHGDKGIDDQLKRITLRSIPKFRDFTNDTLLDILFYTSPVYCQTIVDSVGSELNRIYKLFLSRNPSFKGNVSLTGHSLGSLILFDLLAHQPSTGLPNGEVEAGAPIDVDNTVDLSAQVSKTEASTEIELAPSSSRTVSYTVGTAGTGQPFITYPKIDFVPTAFFALGSPISMFVTVRGIEKLGNDFRFPTCPAFFNIFHPYDPVAYRIETLIDPDFQERPVLIPHHKGRKRIHLELKETMARVGADIKHKVFDAVKNTINTVYHYTGYSKTDANIDKEIQNVIQGEMEKKSEADGPEEENKHIRIGSLNGGRRIDHVLQEAPYETFNEYVFAMSTHVGYWESEDTMLLILTEIYTTLGVQRDRQITGTQAVTSPSSTSLVPNPSNYFTPPVLSNNDPATYQPSAPPMQAPTTLPATQSMYDISPSSSVRFTPAASTIGSPTQAPQTVPLIQPSNLAAGVLLPPNPALNTAISSPAATSGYKPAVIGNRPVVDPSYFPRGVDPTAPMLTQPQIAPPPKVGFVLPKTMSTPIQEN